MTLTLLEYFDFLHDAEVNEISLLIDHFGNRNFEIKLQCDLDCGYEKWNDKLLNIIFIDPVIIHGDIFGHMANAETLNTWDSQVTPKMLDSMKKNTEFGLPIPKHVGSIVFHSGSTIELACEEVQFLIL